MDDACTGKFVGGYKGKGIMTDNEKLKILLLSVFLKRKGGVTNYIYLLIQNLDNQKFHVKHFVQGKSPTKWKNIFLPFIIIYQIIKFKHTIKEYNPDIVHINPSLGWTAIIRDFTFMKIAKKYGIPVLFFIHGWRQKVSNKFKKNGFWRKFFKMRFDLADAIVVSANQFKKELIDLGIESQRIFVSSTMVESEKHRPKIKEFGLPPYEVLFCANMIKSKGIYELLDAIPFVIEKYPQTKFTFVGNGKELERLKEKSKELRIRENIEFTDYVSNIEKIKFLKRAHVFAFPSHTEGFPTVILEAMAAGAPLVVTPVGGLEDALVDGVHGKIIKSMPPQPKEIGEKIITLLSSPELMRRISENNLKNVIEKYDVKVVSSHIEQIYEKISQNR